MNHFRSRIYDCKVFHSRQEPVPHQFTYAYSTFCLDLDEVDEIARRFLLFGVNALSPLRFVPSDSLLGAGMGSAQQFKRSVIQFAQEKGVNTPIARVELLGSVRTFGYSYNPAAFIFGYGQGDQLLFGIVEVTNTYYEKKVYFVPVSPTHPRSAVHTEQKLFYVSPFVELDTNFEFRLNRPDSNLNLQIDSRKPGSLVVLHAVLQGKSLPFTGSNLLRYLLRHPLITLGVMAKIHFQAARLYLKRVPYQKKSDRPELQKGGLP